MKPIKRKGLKGQSPLLLSTGIKEDSAPDNQRTSSELPSSHLQNRSRQQNLEENMNKERNYPC